MLSVAIPTYNRAKLLQENLRNLTAQITELDELVEIVVSDNASSDETASVVAASIKNGSPIIYFRNKFNLGMDENADLAIRRSRGKYVLLFGDDDILEQGALETILHCLNTHPDLGVIYSNFRVFDTSLEKRIDFRDLAFDNISVDSYFSVGLDVIKQTKKIFAAISGGVYRRQLWVSGNPGRFYGSIFIHVGITLDILCRVRAPAYIFKKPLFKYRLNDSAAGQIKPFGDIFAVSFGLLRILKEHKRYIPASVFREMYGKELQWTREKVLGAKARAPVPIIETFRQMRRSYDTSRPDFWLLDSPMLLIPHWLLRFPYRIYRLARYRAR
jgi:glycosyltransferase involved in cell wall biosynthesis